MCLFFLCYIHGSSTKQKSDLTDHQIVPNKGGPTIYARMHLLPPEIQKNDIIPLTDSPPLLLLVIPKVDITA